MSSDTQSIRHLQQENIRLRSENNSMRDYVERMQRSLQALISLQQNITDINPKTNIYSLIHQILKFSLDAVNSQNGSLILIDEDTGELVFVEVIGEARDKLLNFRLPPDTGIAGWVIKNRQVRLVEDTHTDHLFSTRVDQVTGMHTESLICVPLIDGDRTLGAIEAVNTRDAKPFSSAEKEIMALVGQLASNAIVTAEKAQGV